MREITSKWNIEDVLHLRETLTEEQASKVLEAIDKNFDAEFGINWGVIDYWIEELYPEVKA